MQKDLKIGILNSTYGLLLTDRQREVITQYYDYDLSLMEIAQNLGISRQGVLDAIKKGSDQLRAYENTLGIVAKKDEMEELLKDLLVELNAGNNKKALELAQTLIIKNQE